jgi:hypothetical protein
VLGVEIGQHARQEAAAQIHGITQALVAYIEDGWNFLDCTNYVVAMVVIALEVDSRMRTHRCVDHVNTLSSSWTLPANETAATSDYSKSRLDLRPFHASYHLHVISTRTEIRN